MSRRAIWSVLIAALLVTVGAAWFLDNFERVPVKRHEGMQREARRNPWLAAERLLPRLGRTVTRVNSPTALDTLSEGGILILETERQQRMIDQERAARVLEWVERGGYLIVEPEWRGENFLLKNFSVERAKPKRDRQSKSPTPAGDKKGTPYIEVFLPGDPAYYRLKPFTFEPVLAGGPDAEWRAAGPAGDAMLHFTYGRGNVTVVNSLSFFYNENLGDFDHAALVWALAQRYQPGGDIRLAVRLEHPTLWQWLAESARMVLISATILVALWLWHVLPRFGGVRAAPDPVRRELTQHLRAIGRCLWREGGLGHLRDMARQEIAQRLASRHPTLARRLSGERCAALARLSGIGEREIKDALTVGGDSPENFTRAMRTLQRLEHTL